MIRRLTLLAVFVYFIVQVYLIYSLANQNRLGDFSLFSLLRPTAIFICAYFFRREGGPWAFWLFLWPATGLVSVLIWGMGDSLLTWLEIGSEIFLAIPAFVAWKTSPSANYFTFRFRDRFKAYFFEKTPQLETVLLGTPADDVFKKYKTVSEDDGEWLEGCSHFKVKVRDQLLTFAIDQDSVVGVIYDTPVNSDQASRVIRKLNHYLSVHQEEGKLKFLVNNGFGYLYRNTAATIRANYSFGADIFSISRFGYKMK